ncbi:MAG TPA: AAA family ATPase [Acidimicrobiales bacterium]|nr:AAA family ATPase [Acidimicrobiales bacterium]
MAKAAIRLLERDHEVDVITGALRAAEAGSGCVLVLEGEQGTGKTSLLHFAVEEARRTDLTVLSASGAEWEQAFGYGLVKQLFDPLLTGLLELDGLWEGPGALAAPALGFGGSSPRQATSAHGLYWLVRRLARRAPVLVCVDDAQWADVESLQFLLYLVRRVAELRVAVMVGWRSGEMGPASALRAALEGGEGVTVLVPKALSRAAVALVVSDELGSPAGAALGQACFEVSGGNPFLTRELARTLAWGTTGPDGPPVERARQLSPLAVSRSVLARLARLPETVRQLAVSLAVLDLDATTTRVARLTGTDLASAEAGLQQLLDAYICDPAQPIPRLRHPLTRTVIYDQVARSVRGDLHRRAAELLDSEGLTDRAVAHLLVSSAAGAGWAVERLVAAAAALPHEAAVPLLERALAEPPSPTQRPTVLVAMGESMLRAGLPGALEHLQEGFATAVGPDLRYRALHSVVRALLLSGRADEAAELVEAEISMLEPGRAEQRVRLVAEMAELAMVSTELYARARPLLEETAKGLGGQTTHERAVLSALVARRYEQLDTPVGALADQAKRALGNAKQRLADRRSDSLWPSFVSNVLCRVDEQPFVRDLAGAALADAGVRRSALATAFAAGERGQAYLLMGALGPARQDLGHARYLAKLAGEYLALHFFVGLLVWALVEAGQLADAELVLEEDGLLTTTATPASPLLFGRATLRAAQGCYDEAARDIQELEDEVARRGVPLPAIGCRPLKARCLVASGHSLHARELLEEELSIALGFGVASEIGMARREHALLCAGEGRVAELAQAEADLAPTPRRLEHAKALLELGSALRRSSKRAEAREHLLSALEIADSCGAEPIRQRALRELRMQGDRPRRSERHGLEAFTATERRVAELVADGLTNAAISRLLVVSPKTVETHLNAAFRKLGIHRRTEIANALRSKT